MTDAAYVDEAAAIARELTRREARGPGDMEGAWVRLQTRYGLPCRLFWSLRYRKPKSISAFLYHRLKEVYEYERERQFHALAKDIEITKAKAGPNCPAVLAAEALVGEDDGTR
jgi:hypothetical protein